MDDVNDKMMRVRLAFDPPYVTLGIDGTTATMITTDFARFIEAGAILLKKIVDEYGGLPVPKDMMNESLDGGWTIQ